MDEGPSIEEMSIDNDEREENKDQQIIIMVSKIACCECVCRGILLWKVLSLNLW